MNIKETFWNCMRDADNLNYKLGQLADSVRTVDSELHDEIVKIMVLIQEVRTECGIRAE